MAKLQASYDFNFFFTEDGVKNRKEKIKLKAMISNQELQKTPYAAEIKPALNEAGEQYLAMMKVHNSKVAKITAGYVDYIATRVEAQ